MGLVCIISGDADSVVPVTGTRYALSSLNLPVVVPWYSWYHNLQVIGIHLPLNTTLEFLNLLFGILH